MWKHSMQCNSSHLQSEHLNKGKYALFDLVVPEFPSGFRLCSDIGETPGSRGHKTVWDWSPTLTWVALSISLPLQTSGTKFHGRARPKCTRNTSGERNSCKPTTSIWRATGNSGPCHDRSSFLVGRASLYNLQEENSFKNPRHILEARNH